MLQKLIEFYGFRADLLEHGPLHRLFPRGEQNPELRWASRVLEARHREQQSDHFALYRLPELEIFLLVFEVDGHWVRCFEGRPNLTVLAGCLCQRMNAGTYIPSGSPGNGWDELESQARFWWWERLAENLKSPQLDPEDWPQRWADLLISDHHLRPE